MSRRALLAAGLLLAGCTLFMREPWPPSAPAGPTWAVTGRACEYIVTPADPDSGPLSCRLDWGDGDTSNWSDWTPPGTPIALGHTWTAPGGYAVRARARNGRGVVSDWSEFLRVTVLDTTGVPLTVGRRIPVGGEPVQLALDPAAETLYALVDCYPGPDTLYVIDARNRGQIYARPLPGNIFAFTPAPGGFYALRHDAFKDRLVRLGLPGLKVLDSLPLRAAPKVAPLILPGDSLLCVPGYDYLLIVRADSFAIRESVPVNWSVENLALLPDGTSICVEAWPDRILRLDARTLAQLATWGIGLRVECSALSPAGDRVWVATSSPDSLFVLRTEDLHPVETHALDSRLRAITFAPSGDYCCLLDGNGLGVRRVADFAEVARFDEPVALAPLFRPDGLRAWTATETDLIVLGLPSDD